MKYSDLTDQQLFEMAIENSGYTDILPTAEGITEIFLDYALSGTWRNVSVNEDGKAYLTEWDEILSPRYMAINLIRLK